MVSLLEAASPFLLLVPGILPLLFLVHSRLVGSSPLAKPASIVCIFVSFLGLLAAVAAALGLAVLAFSQHSQSIQVAQTIMQSFVEFGYRGAILYLITPRSFAVLASHISLSQREISWHNSILAAILFSTFLISVIQASLAPFVIPVPVPFALGILAALFPIPLTVHLILAAHSARVREIWAFISLLQTFSAVAMTLRIPQGPVYSLCSAFFTVLWGGGVITLFYTLSSTPLPSTTPQTIRLPKFSYISSTSSTSAPIRVQYETPQARQLSGGALHSEDFTALRDPFASPPPVSPVSITTPAPRFPSPIPTSTPRIILSPPPTPINKPSRPPVPKAREIKPQRRGITKQSSLLGIDKRSSSQSLQPLSCEMTHEENWRASESGSDDALFMSEEALLSQILLHSLIKEATPSSLPPQHLLKRDEAGSLYSEISMATIRTRRDENGRRYGSEEVRYSSNSGNFQNAVGGESSNGYRDDAKQAQVVVAPREGSSEVDDGGLQSAKEGGVATAWWAKR